MVNPLLSIIILSFNTSGITLNCLKSILKDKGLEFDSKNPTSTPTIPSEIIIVDNASSDDSTKLIKNFFTKHFTSTANYKIIENKTNLGFSRANNQALKLARGQYVLFLNSDTLILHSAISQALNWLSSHPESLLCTAQLLNPDKTIQEAGGYFPNLLNVATWSLNLDDLPLINFLVKPFHPHTPSFYTKDTFYTTDRPLDWIKGTFMMGRTKALNEIGGFDDSYFMYGEDTELCYRAKLKYPQSQFWYLVGPQIIHLGQASAVHQSHHLSKEYQGIISFFTKHRSPWQLPLVRILLKINALTHRMLYSALGKKDQAAAYQQIC